MNGVPLEMWFVFIITLGNLSFYIAYMMLRHGHGGCEDVKDIEGITF